MRLRLLTVIGLAASLALAATTLCPQLRAAERAPYIHETNPAGNIRVLVRNKHGNVIVTLLVRVNGHVYSVPDERIAGFNDEDTYWHDFHLSPDHRWLFVTCRLYHGVDVAYLYHRDGEGTFVRVRPDGLRFDEAAVRFFSRRLHLGLPDLVAGARVTYFEGWANNGNGLLFHFAADKGGADVFQKHPGVTVRAIYDLRTQRFSMVSKTWSEFGAD